MPQIFPTIIEQTLVVACSKSRSLENLAYGAALGRTTIRKHELLREFDKHPVTKEIKDGPGVDSNFLSVGNLFSFIGFELEDRDPTLPLREALKNGIRTKRNPISKIIKRDSVIWSFGVEMPFLKDLWAVSPYPNKAIKSDWKERKGSWASDIETRGISGFEFFLYSFELSSKDSRSTIAIQTNSKKGTHKKMNSGKMQPVPYLRAMLEIFRKHITGR